MSEHEKTTMKEQSKLPLPSDALDWSSAKGDGYLGLLLECSPQKYQSVFYAFNCDSTSERYRNTAPWPRVPTWRTFANAAKAGDGPSSWALHPSPPSGSARSLVCRALLDNAAVGTDPITRLSPFALAKLAGAQECILLPCRVVMTLLLSAMISSSFSNVAVLERPFAPCSHQAPKCAWLATGCPTCSTLLSYGWVEKQTIPRHSWNFYVALSIGWCRMICNSILF